MGDSNEKKRNKGRGRPKADFTWSEVDFLLESGCSGSEVAHYFGICPHTLYRRVEKEFNVNFSQYLHSKREKGKAKLRGTQYNKAVSGDNKMLIWVGKHLLGQTGLPFHNESTVINVINYADSKKVKLENESTEPHNASV